VVRSKPALMDVMRKAAKKKKDISMISECLTSAEVHATKHRAFQKHVARDFHGCLIFCRTWNCSAFSPLRLGPPRPQGRSM
jgi:hypothetical protein